MNFESTIYEDERYVETCFTGDLTTNTVISYLTKVWVNKPELNGFSELVDVRQVDKVDMDTGELAEIVGLGRSLDDESQQSKMAVVVVDTHDNFKSSLYQTLQDLYPVHNKEVKLFMNKAKARLWIMDNPTV